MGRELATCDTAGVMGPAAGVVASMQAVVALKMLSGNVAAVGREMVVMDLWGNRIRSIAVEKDPECPCCGKGEFPFLAERAAEGSVSLCGRDAVQVRGSGGVELEKVARKLEGVGRVEQNRYFVRCDVGEGVVVTVFADGRMIAGGTRDGGRARALYAKYVGA
jgi:adenylyltransferase/sulfurtransferase